jgi:hypothetical protein
MGCVADPEDGPADTHRSLEPRQWLQRHSSLASVRNASTKYSISSSVLRWLTEIRAMLTRLRACMSNGV